MALLVRLGRRGMMGLLVPRVMLGLLDRMAPMDRMAHRGLMARECRLGALQGNCCPRLMPLTTTLSG